MKIAVLGSGCMKCRQTAEAVRQAVEQAGVSAEIAKVEDVREILKYKVMMTPAVAVDGTVRIAGRVPSVQEVVAIIAPGEGGTR